MKVDLMMEVSPSLTVHSPSLSRNLRRGRLIQWFFGAKAKSRVDEWIGMPVAICETTNMLHQVRTRLLRHVVTRWNHHGIMKAHSNWNVAFCRRYTVSLQESQAVLFPTSSRFNQPLSEVLHERFDSICLPGSSDCVDDASMGPGRGRTSLAE